MWTLQQDKQFKEGAYINYGKQGYFARNYKDGQSNYIVKGTRPVDGIYILRDNSTL